jgi:hypothetical protein
LEDVFLKNEQKQKNNIQGSILIKNETNQKESMAAASSYICYFHTSDGARTKVNNYNNNSGLDPYRDNSAYIQHSGTSDFFLNKADRSTINSETGPRLHQEEDSPFFIKRRIRSSNPHARIKRKPHPVISKHFFKKQMSRHGARNKPPTSREDDTIHASACKSENRQIDKVEYGSRFAKLEGNLFDNNCCIRDFSSVNPKQML